MDYPERIVHLGIVPLNAYETVELTEEQLLALAEVGFRTSLDSFTTWGEPVGDHMAEPLHVTLTTADPFGNGLDAHAITEIRAELASVLELDKSDRYRLVDYVVITGLGPYSEKQEMVGRYA